jgi:hypothetical protein
MGTHGSPLYLSIFSPARWPGLGPARTRPAHGPYWTGLGGDLATHKKKILAQARPKMLFLAILHYKNMGSPPKPRLSPSPTRRTRLIAAHGTSVGRIFSAQKTQVFSAWREPGPAREMLRYSPHRPGSQPSPTGGPDLSEDLPTCQWPSPT